MADPEEETKTSDFQAIATTMTPLRCYENSPKHRLFTSDFWVNLWRDYG